MKFHCCIMIFGVLLFLAVGLEVEGDTSACYNNEKYLLLWDLVDSCISKVRDIHLRVPLEHNCCNSGDTIREGFRPYLKKAKQEILDLEENLFPAPLDSNCGFSGDRIRERSRPHLEKAKQLILELEENLFPDEPETVPSPVPVVLVEPSPDGTPYDPKPLDCSDILTDGRNESGVYTIWPAGQKLEVYCDMDTDGGGWTVIQRRGNFSAEEDFYRGWDDYAEGFGSNIREFWLGNKNINRITNQSQYEVRFDLTDAEGERRFAVYKTFWLDDESKNFTLHIGNYSGDAGDSMAYHNGHVFSTRDSEKSWCAMQRIGAWWYDDCIDSNLNGVFRPGLKGREGITWYRWHNTYSLAGSEIKLRKKN